MIERGHSKCMVEVITAMKRVKIKKHTVALDVTHRAVSALVLPYNLLRVWSISDNQLDWRPGMGTLGASQRGMWPVREHGIWPLRKEEHRDAADLDMRRESRKSGRR